MRGAFPVRQGDAETYLSITEMTSDQDKSNPRIPAPGPKKGCHF